MRQLGRWKGVSRVFVVAGLVVVFGPAGPTRAAAPSGPVFQALPASGSSQLQTARFGAVAASLTGGRVLIAGGFDGSGFLQSAELFDRSTGAFTALATSGGTELQTARAGAVAAALPNGKVLIAGGSNSGSVLQSAELFDPSTGTFSALPAAGSSELQTAREGAVAATLPNGKVLIVGGYDGSNVLKSAELFDPSADTFAALPASGSSELQTARQDAVAATLPNGDVLIAGGFDGSNDQQSAELFDPSTDTFAALPASGNSELQNAVEGAVAMTLGSGQVLIAGGSNSSGVLQGAELFDPSTETFSALSASGSSELQTARQDAVAAPLPDGQVLVAGGFDGGGFLQSAELALPMLPSATIISPASGATYSVGQPVPTSFTCAEGFGGTGLSSCDDNTGTRTMGGGSGHLDTAATGPHAYTVSVASSDGQIASSQISYAVAAAPSASITSPTAAGSYTVGQSVLTSFTCSEGAGGPGLAACADSTGVRAVSGGAGRLDTSSTGTHTYAVTATSKDGQAATSQVIYTVVSVRAAVAPAPSLGALKLTPRTFRPALHGPPVAATGRKIGMAIRYHDTRAATTTFMVLRCLGPHGNCQKAKLAGSFSHRDRAGTNNLRFSGRLRGHALRYGHYMLEATASLADRRSRAISATFVIVAPSGSSPAPRIVAGVGTPIAPDATPACGSSCFSLSSQIYGAPSNPTFVLSDQSLSSQAGAALTLAAASGSNAGEDFAISAEGTVDDFFQAGLLAAGLDSLYGSLEAYEIQYTPDGVDTGVCVGVPTAPTNGTRIVLEPCGVSVQTIWIPDSSTAITSANTPMISADIDTDFSDPQVLTALLPGMPLTTSALIGLSPHQMWGAKKGVL